MLSTFYNSQAQMCIQEGGGTTERPPLLWGLEFFLIFYTTRVKLEMRVRGPFELPRKINNKIG